MILVYTIGDKDDKSYILIDLKHAQELVISENKITIFFEKGRSQTIYLSEKLGLEGMEKLANFLAYRKDEQDLWKVDDLIGYIRKYE